MENQIINLYNDGYSQKEICDKLNLKVHYTNKILKKNGFDTHNYRKVPDVVRNLVCFMIREGYHQDYIAEILDISIHTVRQIDYENNLQHVATEKRAADNKAAIVKYYQEGMTMADISRKLHADKKRIKKILIEAGVYISPEIKDKQILEAYNEGMSIADIIKEYNTGYRRVNRVICANKEAEGGTEHE